MSSNTTITGELDLIAAHVEDMRNEAKRLEEELLDIQRSPIFRRHIEAMNEAAALGRCEDMYQQIGHELDHVEEIHKVATLLRRVGTNDKAVKACSLLAKKMRSMLKNIKINIESVNKDTSAALIMLAHAPIEIIKSTK